MPPPNELLDLARAVSDPALDAAILAEGNVSAASESGCFWIKGSGVQMGSAGPEGFVEVDSAHVLSILDSGIRDEAEVRRVLNDARVDKRTAVRPSTESFMHAVLMGVGKTRFVAHCHPTPLIGLCALEDGPELAKKRLFPDEIVLCGRAACWVPYVAPGLPLAVEIRDAVKQHQKRHREDPKTFWLQNHGLIALGQTSKEAESATRMAIKAARVLLGALQTGQSIRYLTEPEIDQIAGWPDEHFRQRQLWGTDSAQAERQAS
jgi:rhamnose utilization protein RhaD (predicted bifunctional aldolase and dehydrogenase)